MARFLAALVMGLMLSMGMAHAQTVKSPGVIQVEEIPADPKVEPNTETVTPAVRAALGLFDFNSFRIANPLWESCPYTVYVRKNIEVMSSRAAWGGEPEWLADGSVAPKESEFIVMPEKDKHGWTDASWTFAFVQACAILNMREESIRKNWSGSELVLRGDERACKGLLAADRRDAVEAFMAFQEEKKYDVSKTAYHVRYQDELALLQGCLDGKTVFD